jgi:hypothetical protein
MNIVESIEHRDRLHWENDADGWGFISESNRVGWELCHLISAVCDEPELWREFCSSGDFSLSRLTDLASAYGINVETGSSWIRFSGQRLTVTVTFAAIGDTFAWEVTVRRAG